MGTLSTGGAALYKGTSANPTEEKALAINSIQMQPTSCHGFRSQLSSPVATAMPLASYFSACSYASLPPNHNTTAGGLEFITPFFPTGLELNVALSSFFSLITDLGLPCVKETST